MLGIPELLFFLPILIGFVAVVGAGLWLVIRLLRGEKKCAREAGFPSLSAYLKAAPQTDQEKQAAVDLALKGVVICLPASITATVMARIEREAAAQRAEASSPVRGLTAVLAGWQASLVGVVGLILCLRALFAPLRAR